MNDRMCVCVSVCMYVCLCEARSYKLHTHTQLDGASIFNLFEINARQAAQGRLQVVVLLTRR